MTGRKPAPVLIKGISNGKEAPSFIRYGKGKRDFYFAVRRDGRKRTWLLNFVYRCSIIRQLIACVC